MNPKKPYRSQHAIREKKIRLRSQDHSFRSSKNPSQYRQPLTVRRISQAQRFRLILKARFRAFFGRPARIAAQSILVVLLLAASILIAFHSGLFPVYGGFDAVTLLNGSTNRQNSESFFINGNSTIESQQAVTRSADTAYSPVSEASKPTASAVTGSEINAVLDPVAVIAASSSATAKPTVSSPSGTAARTAATTVASAVTKTVPAISLYENVISTAATFPGIDPSITRLWLFPMQIEPTTPGIGLFGATRTNKRSHAGIDLYAPSGTKIYAMTAGRVRNIEVFYQSLLAIEVENLDGTTIRYTELVPLVKVGDTIVRGQQIAKLRKNYDGNCMLHLEIYSTVNPGALTDIENLSNYLNVPDGTRSFRRRSDLVDPSAVYTLPRS